MIAAGLFGSAYPLLQGAVAFGLVMMITQVLGPELARRMPGTPGPFPGSAGDGVSVASNQRDHRGQAQRFTKPGSAYNAQTGGHGLIRPNVATSAVTAVTAGVAVAFTTPVLLLWLIPALLQAQLDLWTFQISLVTAVGSIGSILLAAVLLDVSLTVVGFAMIVCFLGLLLAALLGQGVGDSLAIPPLAAAVVLTPDWPVGPFVRFMTVYAVVLISVVVTKDRFFDTKQLPLVSLLFLPLFSALFGGFI